LAGKKKAHKTIGRRLFEGLNVNGGALVAHEKEIVLPRKIPIKASKKHKRESRGKPSGRGTGKIKNGSKQKLRRNGRRNRSVSHTLYESTFKTAREGNVEVVVRKKGVRQKGSRNRRRNPITSRVEYKN